ncbi:MAG: putative toxin-antitoxin system toxin component, PIN family [Chthoniobacteraceae bacterium]
MKVVCDTNVLIAGLVADGLCRDIVKRRLPAQELFVSEILLEELETKLREKFGMEPDEVPLLQAYRERATLVKPVALPKAIFRDSDDDAVLATAAAARADVIVTGDKDLLVLKEYEGVRILSPREFVELIDNI